MPKRDLNCSKRKAREWKPFAPHITVLLDAHTRAIPGYVVSTKYPDAWVIALAFWRAIMPKKDRACEICGFPTFFETDRGSDFLSEAIAATLAGLGTVHVPDPPYYPNNKGKVERVFQTLDSGCLRLLPGHMDAIGCTFGAALKHVHELFTLQQLDHEIARWLDEEYHVREHSETSRAPAEYWSQTVRLSLPSSEDDRVRMLPPNTSLTAPMRYYMQRKNGEAMSAAFKRH